MELRFKWVGLARSVKATRALNTIRVNCFCLQSWFQADGFLATCATNGQKKSCKPFRSKVSVGRIRSFDPAVQCLTRLWTAENILHQCKASFRLGMAFNEWSTSKKSLQSGRRVLIMRFPCIVVAAVQGDPCARRLGYVDISSVSYRCYTETKLMTT